MSTYAESCAQYRRDIELLEAELVGFASATFRETPLTYNYSDHELNDRAVLGWGKGRAVLAKESTKEAV